MLTSCGGAEPVAVLTHDLAGQQQLYAYAAEPAAQPRQGEQIAMHTYGFEVKSPETPYLCVWRNPKAFGKTENTPPTEIFLTCTFGTGPWRPPASIVAAAEEANKRDQGTLRMLWTATNRSFRLMRLEVEIMNPSSGLHFRSINFGDELADVRFDRTSFAFPKRLGDPFAFDFTARAPRRQNSGRARASGTATLTIKGAATPIPKWLNY